MIDSNTDEYNVTTKAQVGLWSHCLRVTGLARELFPKTPDKEYDDSLAQAEAFIRSQDKFISADMISIAIRYREALDENLEDDEGRLRNIKHELIRTMQLHGYKHPND